MRAIMVQTEDRIQTKDSLQNNSLALRRTQRQPHPQRFLMLFSLAGIVLNLTTGCSHKNTDASNQDADYYKGPVFHSKQAKH